MIRAWARSVVIVLAGVALVACSSSTQPTASPPPASQSAAHESTGTDAGSGTDSGSVSSTDRPLPACAAIWKIGTSLIDPYTGCRTAGGTSEFDSGYDCADGSHVAIYEAVGRTLYAIAHQPIRAMTEKEFVSYLVGTCKPL